jgi:hypothetical protein
MCGAATAAPSLPDRVRSAPLRLPPEPPQLPCVCAELLLFLLAGVKKRGAGGPGLLLLLGVPGRVPLLQLP